MLPSLEAGTKIVLTKTALKDGERSLFEVGEKRSGTLSAALEYGEFVRFKEWDGGHVTSAIRALEPNGTGFILETRTSFYSIEIIEDADDGEFQKWLDH